MEQQLAMVKDFHEKFKAPVLPLPALIPTNRSSFRHSLMIGEVKEYLDGVRNSDLTNIAKELADILYVVYGTILEHGLQDKMPAIFAEVHASNMSKDHHEYKMVKGADYREADVAKFVEK